MRAAERQGMSGVPLHSLPRRSPDAPLPSPSQAAPVTASAPLGASGVPLNLQKPTASNRNKILQVAHRLAYLMRAGLRPDTSWFNDCFSLARGIDYAVSHNDIPPSAHDLPAIIKQVYQQKGETYLQPAIMILMIAAKNASRNNWFLPADSEEILAMANEISGALSTDGGSSSESNSARILSDVISRFFPQIKLVHLLGIFEVKSGYDILVADIYIPRNMGPEDRIRLFVCQADNTETSSCIISPQQVNFLVNGKAVERRTNISLDAGPQFPTDITKMLKYGMNLFQAVGSVSGSYIIAIAVVNSVKISGIPDLQDYIHPVVRDTTLDSEIIEGPSRISLNCPISFKRIKTPVKGHLCNHHQCFDYENYMDLNSRKPTWRCPHCNQSVTYIDLRIDRYMHKILEEASEGVSDVIISADGSWKIVEVQQITGTQSQTRSLMDHQSSNAVIPPEDLLSSSPEIVDLTTEDLEDDTLVPAKRSSEGEDKKFVHGIAVSTWQSPVMGPRVGAEMSAAIVGDMSRISSGLASSLSTSHDVRRAGQINANLDPVGAKLVNRISSPGVHPVLNSGSSASVAIRPSTASAPCPPQVAQARESPWLLHHFESSVLNNEFARPRLPLSHAPANQPSATPEQLHMLQQKRARIGGSTFQSPLGPQRMADTFAPSMIPTGATQGLGSQNLPSIRPTSGQHITSSVRQSIVGPRMDSPTINIRSPNLQAHQTLSQAANPLSRNFRPTAAVRVPSPNNTGLPTGIMASQQSALLAAKRSPQMPSLQTAQSSLQPSRVLQASQPTTESPKHPAGEHLDSLHVTGSSPLRSDGSPGIAGLPSQAQQDWRPTGRMRGSLSGPAYSVALSHYASPPQHVLARPVSQAVAIAPATSSSTYTTVVSSKNVHTSPPATNLENRTSGNPS